MNKASLKKIVSAVVAAATITTLSPLGVSAQWRQNTDSTWNYIEGNKIVQGWENISDIWYYFNSNGKMNIGWICDNGKWYYNNNSGAMEKGWVNDNETWYYLDNTGAMKTGAINIGGKTCIFNKSGELLTVNNASQTTENTSVNNNQEISGQDSVVTISTKSDENKEITNIDSKQNSDGTTENDSFTTTDVNGLSKLPQNYDISVQATAENKILELMNQKRTEAGLQPLTMDNTLLQVSRYKSNHMIQYDYFDHTNPDGTKWTDWLKTIGYKYTATGENIAYNTYDAVELFNQWWNSPGHRANMMNNSYTKVGVGVLNGNGKYMGTQEFSN
ncbi:serine protease [Clostridium beijerinckii]|nr:serine protease [Clostridium beijerinckii]